MGKALILLLVGVGGAAAIFTWAALKAAELISEAIGSAVDAW
jgi:hypothetical protein